jgi:hypothetical protein
VFILLYFLPVNWRRPEATQPVQEGRAPETRVKTAAYILAQKTGDGGTAQVLSRDFPRRGRCHSEAAVARNSATAFSAAEESLRVFAHDVISARLRSQRKCVNAFPHSFEIMASEDSAVPVGLFFWRGWTSGSALGARCLHAKRAYIYFTARVKRFGAPVYELGKPIDLGFLFRDSARLIRVRPRVSALNLQRNLQRQSPQSAAS